MDRDAHRELLDDIIATTDSIVRAIATQPDRRPAYEPELDWLAQLQERFCTGFPVLSEPVDFWETLWLRADRVRDQWLRLERLAGRAGRGLPERLRPALDGKRAELYRWTRQFVCDHAPVAPSAAHLDLGIGQDRPHLQAHHERIEGLYESVKRIGELPEIRQGVAPRRGRPNFAIIYGGGWNVTTFSVLRGAARHEGLNAFVAFDYPGDDLFSSPGGHTLRLAPAGLLLEDDGDEYVLATFDSPAVVHFACPHAWTGRTAHEIGLPVLRSVLTLAVVDDKVNTSRALSWYVGETGADIPLIRERVVPAVPFPADLDDLYRAAEKALDELQAEGVERVAVKPSRGEQAQGVERFDLRTDRSGAVEHAVRLALESSVVVQQWVDTPGPDGFDWRVLVALATDGSPVPVGRFARKGRGEQVEMVPDSEMLLRCGVAGEQEQAWFEKLDAVSVEAFRAVTAYTQHLFPDFPWKPLGGGSYAVPYFLGVDLIGEAMVMEVNGNEVAGMWTHDRLYPELRGQSSRTVLESAREAAEAYRRALRPYC